MILEKSMSSDWLSNTWLVGDRAGGHAVLVDTGGPMEPILAKVEEHRLTVTHALCTHHHFDHTAHSDEYRSRLGLQVCGGSQETALFGRLDLELEDGDTLQSGDLQVRCLHIPGHTTGQMAFLVNGARVFTGDTLFRGSVGGTRAPGHTTFADLHRSIMEILMKLPPETEVCPGHTDPTTIGREWEENAFIRAWRGLDVPPERPCDAMGEKATLLLRAPDYDGGTKCWVRFAGGQEDVVPGSRVHGD